MNRSSDKISDSNSEDSKEDEQPAKKDQNIKII